MMTINISSLTSIRFTQLFLALLCAVPLVSCDTPKKSACDALAERKFGISREEYRPCAREIMEALDKVRTNLDKGLSGEKAALSRASSALGELDTLLSKVGLRAGILTISSTVQPGEKWSEGALNDLNTYVVLATLLYRQCLSRPNQLEFERGVEAHDKALQVYRSL